MRILLIGFSGGMALFIAWLIRLNFVPPRNTAFMRRTQRVLQEKEYPDTQIQYRWVPLREISPIFLRAVVLSEDPNFFTHLGIDLRKLQDAIQQRGDKNRIGSSTLSQQIAKNLFLWTGFSLPKRLSRKLLEAPLALLIEALLTKRRILEIYVNIIQFTPNIFGIEMAAQTVFKKNALNLTAQEASRLTLLLPNPWLRNPNSFPPALESEEKRLTAQLSEFSNSI